MYDLTNFGIRDALLMGAELRKLGDGARSMENVAQSAAQFFFDQLTDAAQTDSACVLSRCYKTHCFGQLPSSLQAAALTSMPGIEPSPNLRCLTLLGSYGALEHWRSRQKSAAHQVIALANEQLVAQHFPMAGMLVNALGVDINKLMGNNPSFFPEQAKPGFNVFLIPQARGSQAVPAQNEFVHPFAIQSVLGLGFVVPPAEIFSVILFLRVAVVPCTAELFKTLALNLKLALLPLMVAPIFDS